MACFSENGRLKIFNGEKNASYTQAKDATEQERTDVSGNARSPPIDGSNEASDTGVERQRDNQDGDEAGRPVQLDGREAKGDYSDPCVFSKMLHSGLYLIKAG